LASIKTIKFVSFAQKNMLNTILLFFNIGGGELFLIILFIIIFFGAKKIPELARGLGKGIREFKNATSDIQKEIRNNASNPLDDFDITKDLKN
jgi:sec-independent protein translocase protein TatA